MRVRTLLLCSFLWSFAANAQSLEHRGQLWWLAFTQAKVGPVMRMYLEAQPRVGLTPGRFDAVLLRGALGIEPVAGLSFWLGFGWIPSWTSADLDDISAGEGRAYQQVTWTKGFTKALKLQLRGRFEQRLLEGVSGPVHRARVMGRFTWTFKEDPTLLLALQDEIFGSFNERPGSGPAGFDQNRAYVGFGWQPTSETLLEVGYLNQLVRRREPLPVRMGHTLMLTTAFFW